MTDLSNAEAALLGLLSEKAMYPYQIEQEVKYRDMRFWTELSMSAIYKLLRKQEKDGFVKSTNEISAENRLKKVYSISEMGKAALKDKIEKLLSFPEHIRWQFDIGMYNADLLSKPQVRETCVNIAPSWKKTSKDIRTSSNSYRIPGVRHIG